jgi:phosphatidate cytidylyltransferase
MFERLLTILVTVPVIVLCTYLGGESFMLTVATIAFFSLNEFYFLMEKMGTRPFVIGGQILSIFFIFLAFSATFNQSTLPFYPSSFIKAFWNSPGPAVVTTLLIILLVYELFKLKIFFEKSTFFSTIRGSFYTGWLLSYLILIRNFTTPRFTFFLIATIWANDMLAYLIGTYIGRARHKLWGVISPKKTWEGAVGGLVGALLSAGFFATIFQMGATHAFILGTLISLTAQISDLIESFYKRKAGVKDSGNLLPGHGGILDRVDSFILTTPVVYYYLLIFGL